MFCHPLQVLCPFFLPSAEFVLSSETTVRSLLTTSYVPFEKPIQSPSFSVETSLITGVHPEFSFPSSHCLVK